jgi:hypothetical protein
VTALMAGIGVSFVKGVGKLEDDADRPPHKIGETHLRVAAVLTLSALPRN